MTTPLLLAVNYRPEYGPRWARSVSSTEVQLQPFGPTDAEELVTALLGLATEVQPIKQFVFAKTDGNPFFIEELVHALVEQGVITRKGDEVRLGPTNVAQLRLPPAVAGIDI